MMKKIDPSKLTLNIKKEYKNTSESIPMNKIDSIVQSIHNAADEKEKTEMSKRTTIDLPKSLHKRVSHYAVEKDLTMKEYFIHLVEKDLTENNR